jgi:acetyl-CoA C-acetyltransferase
MVAYTAEAMGLDPGRELTVAGGLGFMGAPLNFAAGQALIAMVRRLREHPSELGLVQGNGGHATKHALGVFSTSPPDELVLTRTAESVREQAPRADDDAAGDAVIDGITVEYERSGPTRAVAICRLVDGRGRLWANSSDPAILHAAVTEELVGTSVSVAGGEFRP